MIQLKEYFHKMQTKSQAKKEIESLRNQIQDHSYKYYVEDNPDISDSEFDTLYKQLIEIENQFPDLVTPESPTQRVGAETNQAFNQVKHLKPMLSLNNVFTQDDLMTFNKRLCD